MKILASACRLTSVFTDLRLEAKTARAIETVTDPVTGSLSFEERTIKISKPLYDELLHESNLEKLRRRYTFISSNDTDTADQVTISDKDPKDGQVMLDKSTKKQGGLPTISVTWTGGRMHISAANSPDVGSLVRAAEQELAGKQLQDLLRIPTVAGRNIGNRTYGADGVFRMELV